MIKNYINHGIYGIAWQAHISKCLWNIPKFTSISANSHLLIILAKGGQEYVTKT